MHWIGVILTAYAGLVLALFIMQRTLMYPASREDPDPVLAGALGFEIVRIESEDGVALKHWFRPPKTAGGPVVFLLHGNAGHIGHRAEKIEEPFDPDWGVFLMEYRGYGGNPGRPTEEGLIADAAAAFDWLTQEKEIPSTQILLFGESLGGAVAVALAAEREVAALIIEASPSSVARVAQAKYWFAPAKWLVLDKWDSMERIAKVRAPLFLMHGGRDRVVPQRFGRELFQEANEPKTAAFVEEGYHIGLTDIPEVRNALGVFLDGLDLGSSFPAKEDLESPQSLQSLPIVEGVEVQ